MSKLEAIFRRFCDIAIIVECTSTHMQPPDTTSTEYKIMKHCYPSKGEDPKDKHVGPENLQLR